MSLGHIRGAASRRPCASRKTPDDERHEACFQYGCANHENPFARTHLAACGTFRTLPIDTNGSSPHAMRPASASSRHRLIMSAKRALGMPDWTFRRSLAPLLGAWLVPEPTTAELRSGSERQPKPPGRRLAGSNDQRQRGRSMCSRCKPSGARSTRRSDVPGRMLRNAKPCSSAKTSIEHHQACLVLDWFAWLTSSKRCTYR